MNGSEVDSVYIKGKPIIEKGIFNEIDEEKVMHEVRKYEKDISQFRPK